MEKIITIDGAASSGKSSLSRELAQKLGWKWLSTGVFYRGIACVGLLEKFQREKDYLDFIHSREWQVKLSLQNTLFFYKDCDITDQLYQRKIDEQSSLFSCKTVFRKALIPFQRSIFETQGALIAEGRDCGTVIFPQAPLKIFLLANDQIRAERRAKDRHSKKMDILKEQENRDKRDETRDFAPLKQPQDSLIVDTGQHTLEEILAQMYKKALSLF